MKIRWEESVPKFGYLRLHLQDGTTRDATTEDLLRACKASELVVVSAKHVEDMQKLKRECSEPASKADSSRATLCKALDRCSDYEKQAQELRGVLGGDPAGESLIDAARRVVTERETAKAGLRECALAVGLVVQPVALLRENGPMDQVLGAIRNAAREAKERAAAVKAAEEAERLRISERATIAQVDAVIVNRLQSQLEAAIARAEKAEAEVEAARANAVLVTMVGDIGVRNSGDATRLEAILAERDAARACCLACAQAVGITYETDGRAPEAGPMDMVLGAIRTAVKGAAERDEAIARAEKAEAKLARLRTIGVSVRDDGTIVDVRDIPPTGSRIATLEADLAAALARIAELEAPMAEATVEELHIIGHYAQCAAANASPPEAVRAGIRAVAERVRRERCLIARAVAANIDVRVAEDQGGGFLVAAHRAGEDEDVERNAPAAEVPAELARMLSEVGA